MSSEKCPDCHEGGLPRRRFLATSASMAALPWFANATTSIASVCPSFSEPVASGKAETLAGEFLASLSESQRKEICRDFEDPLRSKVHANWHVTKPLIGSDFYSDSQRSIIDKIVRSLTSEEGYSLLQKQMDADDGGQNAYSVAMFGDPQKKSFQWVLTGRHLTLRADGDSVPKTAFGGGIVYGHGEESSAEANLFYYQTKKVNEVFKALDADQSKLALLKKLPAENDIRIKGASGKFEGLQCSKLAGDQKDLVKSCLKTILGPYRAEDGEEAFKLIEAGGGIDALRLAFYQDADLGDDRIWDNWRIEGPNSVIHFRGSPHVHAYINIAS